MSFALRPIAAAALASLPAAAATAYTYAASGGLRLGSTAAAVVRFTYAPPVVGGALVSYWKLDEAGGTRADSHGANHLVDNNTVGSAAGKIGSAASFIAANSESLSRASNAGLQTGDVDWTVGFWLNPTTVTQSGVVGKWSAELEWFVKLTFGGNVELNVYDGGFKNVASAASLSAGVWSYVVVWQDAVNSTINVQVNNGSVGQTTGIAAMTAGSDPFAIGSDMGGSGGAYLDGTVDEVGFWKRVLSADERAYLYGGGTPPPYPFSTARLGGSAAAVFTPASANSFSAAGSGNVVLGSSAAVLPSYRYTAGGCLALGSSAAVLPSYRYAAGGGLRLGSSAASSLSDAAAASGAVVIGSTAGVRPDYRYTAGGRVEVSGAALVEVRLSAAASGGLRLGSTAPTLAVFSYAASGGLALGGAAPPVLVLPVLAGGRLRIGGRATAGAVLDQERVRLFPRPRSVETARGRRVRVPNRPRLTAAETT